MELFSFATLCEGLHYFVTQLYIDGSANSIAVSQSFIYKDYYWLYLVLGGICFMVLYALQAVALYKIASQNGYEKRWMAFVPVLNTYYVGFVSSKNRVYNISSRTMGIIACVAEGIFVALSILVAVSTLILFGGGYASPIYDTQTYGGRYFDVLSGYLFEGVPQSLGWTIGVYEVLGGYVLGIVELCVLVTQVLLYITFFQTYVPRHYFLYTLISVLFPVRGLMIFLSRNGKAVSYREYLTELQRSRYRMYQQYMRDGMSGDGNYQQGQNGPSGTGSYDDPFSEYGGSSTEGKDDDPFEGLGK